MAERPNQILTTILLSPSDRDVLDAISASEGDTGRSAVIRRLIRDEGTRRGLLPISAEISTASTPTEATA